MFAYPLVITLLASAASASSLPDEAKPVRSAVSEAEVGRGPDPRYLAELISLARSKGVSGEKQWLRLGHWRPRLPDGQESQADGEGFFLSPRGKEDPEAELEATLQGFFAEPPVDPPDARHDHPQCRFPARFAYLARALSFDLRRLPVRECPRFQEFWERMSARYVVLVFSSYYMNNPASAFGHTFLRLGKADPALRGERFDLLDQGIDYAASADTKNAIFYAFKGLTGLFRGEFTARPYFYKVREYADYESRDLWEYELALEPGELAMLVGHLWELGQTWFDYYYLTENCSYHVLSAIEVAAPRLELLSSVGKVALPADTVKALFRNQGLVRAIRFRPSARSQLDARSAGFTSGQKKQAMILADGGEPEGLDGASVPERVRLLDTALDLFDVRHGRDVIDGRNSEILDRRQALLEKRSAILVPSAPLDLRPPREGGPERGHGSLRFGAGGGGSSRDGPLVLLEGRLALHDLADPPAGFSSGTRLEFLNARFSYATRSKRVRIDEAWLVQATSLSPFGGFERRISWKMGAGATRVRDAGCPACIAGQIEVGGGPSLLLGSGAFALLVTADTELRFAPDLRGVGGSGFRPGIGPGGLLRIVGSERVVLLGTAAWRYLPFSDPDTTFQAGVTGRLHLGRASLSADWRVSPREHELALTLFLYGR